MIKKFLFSCVPLMITYAICQVSGFDEVGADI